MAGINSYITDVCIFREGARITRRCTFNTNTQGKYSISGLSISLLDDSVQLALEQSLGSIFDVSVQIEESQSKSRKALNELKEESRCLCHHRDILKDSILIYAEEIAEIQKLSYHSRQHVETTSLKDLTQAGLELVEFKHTHLEKISTQKRHAEANRQKVNRQISELQEKIDQVSIHHFSKCITFSCKSDCTTKLTADLTYCILSANWAPSYLLNVKDQHSADLEMRAAIRQNSGEDWGNVQLLLSMSCLI